MFIRVKFKKEDEAIFISHLDLMRTFQRALRRAELPMVFSEGFNPHPEMSFAQALGVGIASEGEYMDITINGSFELEEIQNRLNDKLPKGIKVIDTVRLKEKSKSAMSMVTHGRYLIDMQLDLIDVETLIAGFDSFLSQDNIYAKRIQQKKDRKVTILDIKPLISNIEIFTSDKPNHAVIDCIISCGSNANLKPELIVNSISEYFSFNMLKCRIRRMELFMESKGSLIPLLDVDNL